MHAAPLLAHSSLDPLASIRDYRRISPRIATSGQPTETQFRLVREAGVELVINLALPTSTGALPDEARIAAANELAYVHIPVQFDAPTAEDALSFFDAMDRAAGRSILVHCAMNYRVSSFMYLYRLRAGEAEEIAASDLRAMWEPDEVWQAFIDAWRGAFDLCGSDAERRDCRPMI